MKVICHTNLDCCKRLGWPTKMASLPAVGNLIEADIKLRDNCVVQLEVVRITWIKVKDYHFDERTKNWDDNKYSEEWVPHIELHLPKGRWLNISYFENWFEYRSGNKMFESYQREEERLSKEHYEIYNFDGSLKQKEKISPEVRLLMWQHELKKEKENNLLNRMRNL